MRKFKFLIIEDDQFYRTYVNDLLADLGVEIISAADGEAGLALAVSERPDLIISDIEIPRIQGFVLLRMIRERSETRDIPVILMSGKVEKDLLERHSKMRDSADGYLVKPFSGQALLGLVEKVLGIDAGAGPAGEKHEEEGSKESRPDSQARPETSEPGDKEGFDATGSGRPLRALVVDDSRYICDITGDFLREIGFVVKFAMDGEEGLKEALAFKPDLVLLDVQMPRMNGFVVCERLRKEETTRGAVIVLMSAIVGRESFEKHAKLKNPADAYLQKPFMKSELQDLVLRLTPRAGTARAGLERKMGFLIPSEDEIVDDLDSDRAPQPEDSTVTEKLNEARSALESLRRRESQLESDLESMRLERDRLEDEAFALRSTAEEKEKELRNKLTLLTQRFEETKSLVGRLEEKNRQAEDRIDSLVNENEALKKDDKDHAPGLSTDLETECRGLRRDLAAAVSAKNEIEDQVKHILDKGLVDGPAGPGGKQAETVGRLEAELDTVRKLVASGEAEKKALQGRMEAVARDKEDLQKRLEEAGARLKDLGERESAERALQEELKGERSLRMKAEAEAGILKGRIEEYSGINDRLLEMERENAGLEVALENSEKLRRELELKIGEFADEVRGGDSGDTEKLVERVDNLQAVLNQTVLEAQSVIDQQNAREYQLEENMRSLMNSLQEDRDAFREEKERWGRREEELRTAFEEALAENRRIIGEETARLYPMLLPRKTRPLEVVTGTRRYGLAVAVAVLLMAVFVLGYLVLSTGGKTTRMTDVQGEAGGIEGSVGGDAPALPTPWISPSVKDGSYGEIWRRQTGQSVSDDMMIQATFHTLRELETAIMHIAEKEGWTRQRRENALQGLMDTYDLDNYYYVTVFSRNLREGYPGYADNFQDHLALRDDTGRETMAFLPGELAGSRFIISRVSAAGREMNPDYLYEAGVTVAFARGNLVEKPRVLQLVIYDVGAVPIRVLTWDLAKMVNQES